MNLLNHRLAMLVIALALQAPAGPVKVEGARLPAPAEPRRTPGNPSDHMPHQGKRGPQRGKQRGAQRGPQRVTPKPQSSSASSPRPRGGRHD